MATKAKITVLLGILLAVFQGGAILAQEAPLVHRILPAASEDDSTPFADESDYPTVRLAFTAADAFGLPVTGLTAAEFELFDGQLPVDAFTLEPLTDPRQPISLMILLDLGGELAPYRAALTAAIIQSYQGLEPWDESGLIAFSGSRDGAAISLAEPFPQINPAFESPFTSDEGALINLLNGLAAAEADAGSPLHDAVVKGARMTAAAGSNPVKGVLLISDGYDMGGAAGGPGSGSATAEIALNEAAWLGVPLFTIGVGPQINRDFLSQLAAVSGGSYQEAEVGETAALIGAVTARLKGRYLLSFRSGQPADDSVRQIRLRAAAGDAAADILYQARPPVSPLIEGVTVSFSRRQPEVPLDQVVSVSGVVTLRPQIASRGPLQSVNYYLGDSEYAVFSATEPPWAFEWDSSQQPAGQETALFIQAVAADETAEVGNFSAAIQVAPCDFNCRLRPFLGDSAARLPYLALSLAAVGAALFIVLRRRQPAVYFQPAVEPAQRQSPLPSPPPMQSPLPVRTPTPAPAAQTPVGEETPLFQDLAAAADPLAPFRQPGAGPADTPLTPTAEPAAEEPGPEPAAAYFLNPKSEARYPLGGSVTIGAGDTADIRLPGKKVAPRHAQVSHIDDTFVIRALTSTRITKVNGSNVMHRQLADGDLVLIGDHQLLFRLNEGG